GGEQQRVAIARALINNPTILLADEPTGHLDPTTSLEILKILQDINDRGTTVLMATHDIGTISQFHRRVVTLEKGAVTTDAISQPEEKKAAVAVAEVLPDIDLQTPVASRRDITITERTDA